MKHLRRLTLTLVLLLSVVAVYAGGIKNAKELLAFVTAINKGEDYSAFKNEKGEVCLEADIDMAKVKKMPAIQSFGGTFDGQGYALKNWKAQNGLFHELGIVTYCQFLQMGISHAFQISQFVTS